MGKRQRSAPKGRRWGVRLHVFASSRQRKTARQNGAKTLDSDSRKCDSSSANTKKGLPERRRDGGLFLLHRVLLYRQVVSVQPAHSGWTSSLSGRVSCFIFVIE